jgi:phage major head subunit gpT-like protein
MITRSVLANQYVPGYFALANDSYMLKRAESQWKKMCSRRKSTKAKEEDITQSDLGLPSVKGEGQAVTFDQPIAGAAQTWVHIVYALAVRISEEAVDDNLYQMGKGGSGGSRFPELFKALGISMAENEETLMADFFNYGTATTYHSTRNSKALFATDHPRLDGTTFSNKATSADLTYTSFWAGIIAAENQYDNRQKRIKKQCNKLWVPPQYEKKAREVMYSPDQPDTSNRAISAYKQSGRKIELVVWRYMTDEDAFIYQLDGTGIIHFTRRKTRFAQEGDFLTGDMMVKADQRWSAEIEDPQCFYGNIPA